MENNQTNPPKEKSSENEKPEEKQRNEEPFWGKEWEKWTHYRI